MTIQPMSRHPLRKAHPLRKKHPLNKKAPPLSGTRNRQRREERKKARRRAHELGPGCAIGILLLPLQLYRRSR